MDAFRVLVYQAEKALDLLGFLYAEQRMFDRFVPVAQEMGTRKWQRITRLADAAENNGQPDLAIEVYEACLGPGSHERFLREKYVELQNRLR
jgi:hypothetical protein